MKNKIILAIMVLILLFTSLHIPYVRGSNSNNSREYVWTFLGEKYEINLSIPQSDYAFYKVYPGGYRISFNTTYLQYFLTPDDKYLRKLAFDLRGISKNESFDNLSEINLVLSFVQETIKYEDDYATTGFVDYYKFPIETLVEGGGDCEDKSMLLATLLHILGYDVILFTMSIVNENVGHVAVGIHLKDIDYKNPLSSYLHDFYYYNGKKYYYMESTSNETLLIGGYSIHYYVGISPTEAGFNIKDLESVPFGNYHYRGYHAKNSHVEELPSEKTFPWFAIYLLILSIIFVPLFIKSVLMERKTCPSCGREMENWFNYCPYCGYWLRGTIPPPPPPKFEDSFEDIKRQ